MLVGRANIMDQVILHIGMHKTGSSSIQAALKDYDDGETVYASFQERNHSIPIYTGFSSSMDDYHIWVNAGLKSDQIKLLRNQYIEHLKGELERKDRKRLIISGEDIGVIDDNGKKKLISLLQSKVKSVVLICYVRSPGSFSGSIFQQSVKRGLKSIPERISPKYRHRIELFREILGTDNVIVKEFSKGSLYGDDVVDDFIKTFSLSEFCSNRGRVNEGLSDSALKLLWCFNKTNPCSVGDPVLTKARSKLISDISRVYGGSGRKSKSVFANIADFSEIDYLRKTFSIDFSEGEAARLESSDDLYDFINDLSDVDLKPLEGMLIRCGIEGNFSDIKSKLNRFYYYCVYQTQVEMSADSAVLRSSDADILREVALRYENQKPVLQDEALALMKLALRARPNGPFIRRKVKEWGG